MLLGNRLTLIRDCPLRDAWCTTMWVCKALDIDVWVDYFGRCVQFRVLHLHYLTIIVECDFIPTIGWQSWPFLFIATFRIWVTIERRCTLLCAGYGRELLWELLRLRLKIEKIRQSLMLCNDFLHVGQMIGVLRYMIRNWDFSFAF